MGASRADDATSDAGIDASLPDATINPTAGYGVFALRFDRGGAKTLVPVRLEPTDGGSLELACRTPVLG